MHHNTIVCPPRPSFRPFDISRLNARLGLRQGFVDAARRAATPHVVDCNDLTRQNLQEPGDFEYALQKRRAWCEQNSPGDYEIEPIGSGPNGLTGRRFRFTNDKVAALFKVWFETDLQR